jgi:hypothetical protein
LVISIFPQTPSCLLTQVIHAEHAAHIKDQEPAAAVVPEESEDVHVYNSDDNGWES